MVLCTSLLVGLMFTISLPSFSRPLDQPTYRALPAQVAAVCCVVLVWCGGARAGGPAGQAGAGARVRPVQTDDGGGGPAGGRDTGAGHCAVLSLLPTDYQVQGANHPAGPWTEYQFLYKPGNVTQPPLFVLPHQPRL